MAKAFQLPITFPLSPKERSTLFFKLAQVGCFCIGSKLSKRFDGLGLEIVLLVACEESRFSPRLLGILIDFFSKNFSTVNPFLLAKNLSLIATPQTLGVISEFVKKINNDANLKSFFDIVLRDLKPVPWQYFYNPQTRPRPQRRLKEIMFSPQEFKLWGFWSDLDPYLKEQRPKSSPWKFNKESRRKILAELFRMHRHIQLGDYLQALGNSISRQQAYHDLQSMKGVRKTGDKRGRIYTVL